MLRRHLLLGALAAPQETPRAYAERLSRVYGQEITDIVYTQTFALIGRWRLGQRGEVKRILHPWLSGERDSLAKPTASHYSGHLAMADIPEGRALVERAAAMAAADPKDNEMSDSVFMVCPLLARAGNYDGALAHFRKMEKLCLRPDGIYRHSPLCEAAWGRGNGFPMLGLALALSEIPARHPASVEMLGAFRKLAAALKPHQDKDGMWHQVIDAPESFAEFSSTAMIATAMHRGVKRGWLRKGDFAQAVSKAWSGVRAHTTAEGDVLDVCESTGKLKTLDEYLRRKAIRGRDPRGGSMALLFATELL
jgi:hypothetical protein